MSIRCLQVKHGCINFISIILVVVFSSHFPRLLHCLSEFCISQLELLHSLSEFCIFQLELLHSLSEFCISQFGLLHCLSEFCISEVGAIAQFKRVLYFSVGTESIIILFFRYVTNLYLYFFTTLQDCFCLFVYGNERFQRNLLIIAKKVFLCDCSEKNTHPQN